MGVVVERGQGAGRGSEGVASGQDPRAGLGKVLNGRVLVLRIAARSSCMLRLEHQQAGIAIHWSRPLAAVTWKQVVDTKLFGWPGLPGLQKRLGSP